MSVVRSLGLSVVVTACLPAPSPAIAETKDRIREVLEAHEASLRNVSSRWEYDVVILGNRSSQASNPTPFGTDNAPTSPGKSGKWAFRDNWFAHFGNKMRYDTGAVTRWGRGGPFITVQTQNAFDGRQFVRLRKYSDKARFPFQASLGESSDPITRMVDAGHILQWCRPTSRWKYRRILSADSRVASPADHDGVRALPVTCLGRGGRGEWRFLLDANHYLIRESTHYLGGSPRYSCTYSYSAVGGETRLAGWFASWLNAQEQVTRQEKATVTELRINRPMDDVAFSLDLPKGTLVVDGRSEELRDPDLISRKWILQGGGKREFIEVPTER